MAIFLYFAFICTKLTLGTLQSVLNESLEQVFGLAGKIGFDGVELDWRDLAEAETGGALGPERRAAIRGAAELAKVEIPSVAAHFLNRAGIASADEEEQRFGMAAVRSGISLCRDLGADLLLVPFFGAAMLQDQAAIQRLISNLKQLAAEAEGAQITLAIEHTLPADQTADLLDAVGSAYIANYWDMGNCMSMGYDPLAEIRQLGNHLARVHAKEYDQGDGPPASLQNRRSDGLNTKPLGQGQVPLREIVLALRQIGYDGYIVLETGQFDDATASAQVALAALRQALTD